MNLKNIRIILVQPSHPGNIGAVARAMKTMGLNELYLVNPKIFPSPIATERAVHGVSVLEKAVVVNSLEDALENIQISFSTSVRERGFSIPIFFPEEAIRKTQEFPVNTKFAFVFGCETSGLSNHDIELCNFQIRIPTIDDCSSLNLASAVQIITYEIFKSTKNEANFQTDKKPFDEMADQKDVEFFYQVLEQKLIACHFLDEQHPKNLMRRLRRLFQRTNIEKLELNILNGIIRHLS